MVSEGTDTGLLIAQFLVITFGIVEILARLFPRYGQTRKPPGAPRVPTGRGDDDGE